MLESALRMETKSRINELLLNRGMNKQDIEALYFPSMNAELIDNTEEAADMFLRHIVANNKIAVLFDTDVDGICAGTIMYRTVKRLARAPLALINNTKTHGITEEVFLECKNNNIKLIIVVDAGSNDYYYQEKLNSLGIDVLVLDHHEIEIEDEVKGEELGELYKSPRTVVVNCKDGVYGNKDLSGTGVVYKFCQYIESKFITADSAGLLEEVEEYVGISILSDVCSMTSSENRHFVNKLLSRNLYSPFTREFLEYGVSQTAFTFGLIPAINSMIRTGNSEKAKNVFIYNSPQDIKRNREFGKQTNELQRKVMTQMKSGLDVKILENFCFTDITKIQTSLTPELNKNFTGLVATIIKEHYEKPTLVTIRKGDLIRGSFRASDGANYRRIFNTGGIKALGHESAFGIITNKEKFSNSIKDIIRNVPNLEGNIDYDFELDVKNISKEYEFIHGCALFNELSGKNLPKIKIKLNIDRRLMLVDFYEKYLKIRVGGIEITGFSREKVKEITDYIIISPEIEDLKTNDSIKFFLN